MIKFFRKIRQKLLSENKFSKYLIYAIGEIVLVVIGILIALGINNWNSERLLREAAHQNLKVLKINIDKDINQLQKSISFMDSIISFADKLNNTFQGNNTINEKTIFYLLELVIETNFDLKTNTLEALNQRGEFNALDENIQQQITTYYSSLQKVIEREKISNDFIKMELQPYLIKNYSYALINRANPWPILQEYLKNDQRESQIINKSDFMKDANLEGHVFARFYQIKYQKEAYELAINKGNRLLKTLDILH